MPPRKKRKHDFSKNDWKARRGRATAERNKQGNGEDKRGSYKMVVRQNPLLEKFYQGQGFIPTDEWDQFLSIMKEDLPATFRITGSRSLAEHVLSCLQKRFFSQLSQLEIEGETVPPPKPLPWYPHNLAWNVSLTRKFIRKSPLVSKFHAFLVHENEQGNISRQEAVSMIPPLLLDVKSEHKVLDMCAAPGSKTAQLIEFLHAEDTAISAVPSGVVVANDADNKRCYMLVHQAKRLNSPCFMVTNHDASVFPMLYYHDEADVRHPLYYDRVLCDVPCSGDGTLRKNPTIWKRWTPGLGNGLHKLQLRILNRGLELLTPGGQLVYSTCSLNPVEDEAVVAAAQSICKGTVELVDVSDKLNGLERLHGLTTWKVMTKSGEWLMNSSEIPANKSSSLSGTMFPPKQEELETLHLQRCCRILPHHQNTGGFFIAVFKKLDWLPWQRKQRSKERAVSSQPPPTRQLSRETDLDTTNVDNDSTGLDQGVQMVPDTSAVKDDSDVVKKYVGATASVEQGSNDVGAPGVRTSESEKEKMLESEAGKNYGPADLGDRPPESVLGRPDFRKRRKAYKEDPYVFLEENSDVFQSTKSYYGLSDTFPSNQLLTRTYTGKKRNIYLCSRLVKELTKRNEYLLKIINVGVKVMARCEHKNTSCSFRLTQENATLPLPHLPKKGRNVHQPTKPLFQGNQPGGPSRSGKVALHPPHGFQGCLWFGTEDLTCTIEMILGIDAMVQFITAHRIQVTQEDLSILLHEVNPLTTSLSQMAQMTIASLGPGVGPAVFVYTPENSTDRESQAASQADDSSSLVISCPIHLSGWVAAKSVRLYLDKNYRYHFLAMLGHDPPVNQSLSTISAKKTRESSEEVEGDNTDCDQSLIEGTGESNEELKSDSNMDPDQKMTESCEGLVRDKDERESATEGLKSQREEALDTDVTDRN